MHLMGGAVGTELARRGFPLQAPQWSAAANVVAPEIVAQIHRDYAAAGAELVTANTTSVHQHTVGDAYAEHCDRAIELARSAGVRVAGSLAMLPRDVRPDERRARYQAVAAALHGSDVLLLEGFLEPAELLLALDATARWSGPRWAALAGPGAGGLTDVIAAAPASVALFLVHCCTLEDAHAALDAAREAHPDAPLGAYPSPSDDDETFARALVDCARTLDLAWIGSCCGSTPRTTTSLATALAR